jgi:hypothetical protein
MVSPAVPFRGQFGGAAAAAAAAAVDGDVDAARTQYVLYIPYSYLLLKLLHSV